MSSGYLANLATGWTVWGSYPIGGAIFRTHPDRPSSLHTRLYNRYQVSFLDIKQPWGSVDHPNSYSMKDIERVELYLCFLPGTSWPVLG
jgi:hypothetical protein